MFERIHGALDVALPSGAYERLRNELTKRPVKPQRWPAFNSRWSNMGFKVAAGVALVAIAIATAAAVIALHTASNNSVPAGTGISIPAYQRMVSTDFQAAGAAWSDPCDPSNHSGCLADANRSIPVIQHWIDDLNRAATPPRFAVVDAEMRSHLSQSLGALRDIAAASQAGDDAAIDRSFIVAVYAAEWTGGNVPAILGSHQLNEAGYVQAVRSQKNAFDTCGACVLIYNQHTSCATSDGVPCLALFDEVSPHFDLFEASLVQNAAPAAYFAKDAVLQADFAKADAVLLTMRLAVAANDQAGFDAGAVQLKRIAALVDQDAGKIIQG